MKTQLVALVVACGVVSIPAFSDSHENCGLETQETALNLTADPNGVATPFPGFVEEVKGNYQILLVNGHAPKPDNQDAEVAPDTSEGLLTLPFCEPSGVCNPGYMFFPYAKTQAFKKTISPDTTVVTLLLTQDGRVDRFTWTNTAGRVTFRNFQYQMSNGAVVVLEHELVKQ